MTPEVRSWKLCSQLGLDRAGEIGNAISKAIQDAEDEIAAPLRNRIIELEGKLTVMAVALDRWGQTGDYD